jgi:hypothetical protein
MKAVLKSKICILLEMTSWYLGFDSATAPLQQG